MLENAAPVMDELDPFPDVDVVPPPPPAITKYSTCSAFAGVTLLLAALGFPVPIILVAVTVNV
jgi:hypothetical protein